ncbi:MAG: FtsQ-type POTRA domain-containing protein [Gemmatimonadota bacterium]|nr:MAG: FtsQ-type POTRA domain-containing protein [Gemmatimonadota bacterium]
MNRRVLWSIVVATGVLALLATPLLLRHVSFFRVRQIEVVGVQYHSTDWLLEALAIEADQNLFAAKRRIERRVLELPGVMGVKIERKMPGTLKIVVAELRPVAFWTTPTGLAVLDADANHMDYDPAIAGFDLPFVDAADTVMLQALASVRSVDPALFEQVDFATHRRDGTVVLHLGERQILLRGIPTTSQIETLRAVRDHIAVTGHSYNQLDARFDHQIVARGDGD